MKKRLSDGHSESLTQSGNQIVANLPWKHDGQFQSALLFPHEANFHLRVDGLNVRRFGRFFLCHLPILSLSHSFNNENTGT
jgi:hypothetical protein